MAFSKFEERAKEWERARVIFKYALDNIPKSECQELYKNYTSFEKRACNRIIGGRRVEGARGGGGSKRRG
jgi:crooked neck